MRKTGKRSMRMGGAIQHAKRAKRAKHTIKRADSARSPRLAVAQAISGDQQEYCQNGANNAFLRARTPYCDFAAQAIASNKKTPGLTQRPGVLLTCRAYRAARASRIKRRLKARARRL
ncbi:hypothetical protein [Paraburkholderia sp.]|uniref:hypothetical protein n=1 Tax=Paraburkholderia sp. TaxID=1926495 RepID=UPI00286F9DA0|nr:hypothetical protein [Paraburkholderia sp.]